MRVLIARVTINSSKEKRYHKTKHHPRRNFRNTNFFFKSIIMQIRTTFGFLTLNKKKQKLFDLFLFLTDA